MRIAFAGTPPFAAAALEAILGAGHEVVLVLTQPDRPAGRGLKRRAGAVGALAGARALPLLAPRSLREPADPEGAREALQRLRSAAPDVLVVAAYGLLLPPAVLDAPRGLAGAGAVARAVNIHASLLPRWRGAAPVARAIEAGDRETGVTLMQMDAGLDTGPMLVSETIPIDPADTAGTLTARLAQLGAGMMVSWLERARAGRWSAVPQPADGASYARKIGRDEAWLDWGAPAALLARRVRAFDPEPGASGRLGDVAVKIWSTEAVAGAPGSNPGTVVSAGPDGIGVACGEGVLLIRELQRAGGRRLRAREFLAGSPIAVGARWQVPAAGGAPT
jgi:methionyl-tRNA formyltransferase